jgi:hypothetical protein
VLELRGGMVEDEAIFGEGRFGDAEVMFDAVVDAAGGVERGRGSGCGGPTTSNGEGSGARSGPRALVL